MPSVAVGRDMNTFGQVARALVLRVARLGGVLPARAETVQASALFAASSP